VLLRGLGWVVVVLLSSAVVEERRIKNGRVVRRISVRKEWYGRRRRVR